MTAQPAATNAQPTTAQARSDPVHGVFKGDNAAVSTFEQRVYLNLKSGKGTGRMAFTPEAALRLARHLITASGAVAQAPVTPRGA